MFFDLPIEPQAGAAIECAAHETASVAAASQARRNGEFAEASRRAGCVIQLHPDDSDAWFELGAAKFALGERGEAKNAWLRALDLAPSNDDARLGLARLARADGDVGAARRWLASI